MITKEDGMVEKIIEYCAKNRFVVFSLFVVLVVWGVRALDETPLDAIPDLSDTQVIVFTEWMGRSPQLIEDQVTYPIIARLVAAPEVKTVRGVSMFGMSFIYVIFEDGTDLYWARSRVLEYLGASGIRLPEGVKPVLGPDATGVGWVFEYALVDRSGAHSLAELRSLQDWHLKYFLEAVPGVAEVASVGGFVKQYQVNVDPAALQAHGIPLTAVIDAVRKSNRDVGGRVVEFSSTEYFVRGRGYITSLDDIRDIPVGTDGRGTPVFIRNVATVETGPDIRRGLAELDGLGETAGGIVVMRQGENALDVIERVKTRLADAELPDGVELVTTYDRSDLIGRAIAMLTDTLLQEMAIIALVIILFLLHLRSALVPLITLPVAVLLSFIPMNYMGLTANIMSLGGIAIAIGDMVDASIVLVENSHQKLVGGFTGAARMERLIGAMKEVGRPIFYSLLVITVSFLPIFTLEGQEGRLFRPLAFTKTFSMLFAAVVAITLAPPLIGMFVRGKFRPEDEHPVSRMLQRIYHPVIDFTLKHGVKLLAAAVIIMALTVPVLMSLGSEFMPPLNEGSILFMPTSVPGMSAQEASRILSLQDRILKEFPEVRTVFGKAGRAETATDPAPLSMMETVITLHPEEQWRPGMTWEKLIAEMDAKLKFPGMANIWWMPVQTRTEMLTTGVRSNLGLKVFGSSLDSIQRIAIDIEKILGTHPDVRSVFAERITGGYYLDFTVRRQAAARYGLTVDDVNMIVESAIGGANITWTVEGKERYPVNVRYARELRSDLDALGRVLVPIEGAGGGKTQVPLAELADISITGGPPMINNENGSRLGYVFVDVAGESYGDFVKEARDLVKQSVDFPPGYYIEWTGQYEHMERMKEHLLLMVPLTLFLVLFLIYMNTRSVGKTLLVLLAVPFSLVGAFWLLYLLDYNLSNAVWVGLIALAGLDAQTGIIMLLYLDLAVDKAVAGGGTWTVTALKAAIHEGAVKRIRPKLMTMGSTVLGLIPIMWSDGAGSDVLKRIAAPMVGGIVTSVAMELVLYPAIYYLWKKRSCESE